MICASVLLDLPCDEISNRIATQVHDSCRANQLTLQGFPDFGPIVSALRNRTTDVVEKNNYKVCKLVDSQKLAVLQVYAQRWLDEDMTKEQATQIITEHNAKFNQDGDFLQGEAQILARIKNINLKWGWLRQTATPLLSDRKHILPAPTNASNQATKDRRFRRSLQPSGSRLRNRRLALKLKSRNWLGRDLAL